MDSKKYRFETLQIHAGLQPDEPTGARGVAIYPTAAYRFKNCDHAARLFELSEGGNIYTRLQNPTTTAYEQRIAALYGAVGALAVSSGMSAILIAVLSLAAEGDNIVASPFLYGGTYNQFRTSLRRLGIDCRIAPSERPEDFEALIDSRTKALYAESMGNPTCAVPDLEALGVTSENNPNLYRNVKEFYAEAGDGTELWLTGYAESETFANAFDKDNAAGAVALLKASNGKIRGLVAFKTPAEAYELTTTCLLYTSDAADEL